jgi:hypothetical protein
MTLSLLLLEIGPPDCARGLLPLASLRTLDPSANGVPCYIVVGYSLSLLAPTAGWDASELRAALSCFAYITIHLVRTLRLVDTSCSFEVDLEENRPFIPKFLSSDIPILGGAQSNHSGLEYGCSQLRLGDWACRLNMDKEGADKLKLTKKFEISDRNSSSRFHVQVSVIWSNTTARLFPWAC